MKGAIRASKFTQINECIAQSRNHLAARLVEALGGRDGYAHKWLKLLACPTFHSHREEDLLHFGPEMISTVDGGVPLPLLCTFVL